jgi:type II secretory pathway pseudopilin PulG
MLFVVVVLGLLAVVGMRVLPTFVEYRAVQSAIKKAHASANTIPEIQKAFDRSAAIDDITVMTGKDLDIAKVNDDFVISFAYTKKIPLFGPVSLTIDYAGNSSQL